MTTKRKASKKLSKEEWLREGTPEPEQILLSNRTNRQWFILTDEEREEIAEEN